MGLLPAAGSIRYDGLDLARSSTEERVAHGISLVPEKRELFSSMSVQDNLKLGAFPRKRAGDRHFMDKLDPVYAMFPRLKERARQDAGTLSGGERQMLALGRALMAKPRLLMLDEPSLGLAPRIVKDIFHIISDLRTTGVAILLIEQNARAALQVSDYGYVIETGEITIHGKASELAHDQRVIDAYLGLARKAA
jgi:branched-chain amino acid transport system ATP-binding protein